MAADLDHVALGAWSRAEVAAEFGPRLGGREVSRFDEGSWSGIQLSFAAGIRLEVLEPMENPADDFLARFLQHTGPGPHHITFKVDDIEARLADLRGLGIEPLKVDLSNPGWREAFLHPSLGLGTVVQLAQQGGPWDAEREIGPAPDDAVKAEFLGAELLADLAVAQKVFGQLLSGTPEQAGDGILYRWPHGGRLLLHPAGDQRPRLKRIVFRDAGGAVPVEPGERPIFDGPATVLTLAAGEPWPPLSGGGERTGTPVESARS